jgi:hypothetical protein
MRVYKAQPWASGTTRSRIPRWIHGGDSADVERSRRRGVMGLKRMCRGLIWGMFVTLY